jgi:hypothetical protein
LEVPERGLKRHLFYKKMRKKLLLKLIIIIFIKKSIYNTGAQIFSDTVIEKRGVGEKPVVI